MAHRLPPEVQPASLALILLGGLLAAGPLFGTQAADTAQVDSAIVDTTAALPPPSIFHSAPRAIPNNRPYVIDLFVSLDPAEIEEVHLFVRTDSTRSFQEFTLRGQYGRYRHTLTAEQLGDSLVSYFFLLSRRDYGLVGYPQDLGGGIRPFQVKVVEPTLEFFHSRRRE